MGSSMGNEDVKSFLNSAHNTSDNRGTSKGSRNPNGSTVQQVQSS